MLLRQIRCFLAVARTGSFTTASKTLNLSQPSLGSHIRQLETRYGVVLFTRGARGAVLTPAGESFLAHAQRVSHEAERAERALLQLRDGTPQTLRLGVTPTSEVTLLPDLLQRGAAHNPPIRLALQQGHSEALIRDVAQNRLEAALCYDVAAQDDVATFALYCEDLFLVGPPGERDETRDIAFARLDSVPLVLDRRFGAIRRRVEDLALARRLRLNVQQEVEPADIKRALIHRHACFTIVPFGLFSDDIRHGRMAAWRIVDPVLTRTLHLAVGLSASGDLVRFVRLWLDDIVAAAIVTGDFGWRRPDDRTPGAEGKPYHSPPKSLLGRPREGR